MNKLRFALKLLISFLIISFITITIYVNFNYHKITETERVHNGYYEISGDKKKFYLDGEWEFYESKLLVTNNDPLDNIKYVQIPSKKIFDNDDVLFYGSYRMFIESMPVGSDFCIAIDNFSGAYNIFINKQLVSSSGVVSKDYSKVTTPGESTIVSNYSVLSIDPIEVVIEVASTINGSLYTLPIIYLGNEAVKTKTFELIQKAIIIGMVLFSILVNLLRLSIESRKKNILIVLIALCLFTVYIVLNGEIYAFFETYLNFPSVEKVDIFLLLVASIGNGFLLYLIVNNYKVKGKLVFLIIHICFSLLMVFSEIFEINIITDYSLFINAIYLFYLCGVCLFSIKMKENNLFISRLIGSVGITVYIASYLSVASNTGNLFIYPRTMTSLFILYGLIAIEVDYNVKILKGYKIIEQNEKISKDNAQYKITLLLSQIKPHFLYNTLNTIKYLCKTNPVEAEEAILKFSTYLRSNMNSITEENLIPVSQEIIHVQNYVDIEKIRFRERLNVIYNINYTEFMIPPLTIQAIVENAIKHGVSKKSEGGTVIIETYYNEDYIYIVVTDTGVGFDTNAPTREESLGLKNIKKRIKMAFNGEFIVESVIKKGTKVTIKIPKNKNN